MDIVEDGSVLSPEGFRVGSARAGIKTAKGQQDVALIVCEAPAACAGVFTTNKFRAAPVLWNQSILPSDKVRAVAVNSGNANACTGEQGLADAKETAALVAKLVGCEPRQVAVCSTGIIGHPLPMERLAKGLAKAFEALSDAPKAARRAEKAILTTDNMATMLAFLTTDAHVPAGRLREMVARAAALTFNRITVDGDSSTNDTVLVLAGGASGAVVPAAGAGREAFEQALLHVMGDLARQIVRDGEGATKLIEVTVEGARTEAAAETAARAIAESQLVKCAVHGGDPNWGRILCAAGYCGVEVEPERVKLDIGEVTVFENGLPTGADAASEVAGVDVSVRLNLGAGRASATVWTCDLSKAYVEINAEYHT